MRKRLLLVRERAMHLISAQSQIWRSNSQRVDSTELKRARPELLKVFDHPNYGNKYLGWAFVELAHSIIRHNKTAHRFYQRKRAQRNGALATGPGP